MNTRFNVKAALLAAFATTALTAVASTSAMAYYAGETAGLALGAPLPQGFYFVDTTSGRSFSNTSGEDTLITIPVVAWSTPWEFLGGRIEAYTAPVIPAVVYFTHSSTKAIAGLAGPAVLVGEAWDIGSLIPALSGFYFSNFVGGYMPINTPLTTALGTKDAFLFNERAAFTYLKNGYNLTAHLVYETYEKQSTGTTSPDDFMYDLTATKTFGKWEVGPVAWGAHTFSRNGSAETSDFAMGALVGYNLAGATLQVYGGTDVTRSNLSYNDSRVFGRIIVPLGDFMK